MILVVAAGVAVKAILNPAPSPSAPLLPVYLLCLLVTLNGHRFG